MHFIQLDTLSGTDEEKNEVHCHSGNVTEISCHIIFFGFGQALLPFSELINSNILHFEIAIWLHLISIRVENWMNTYCICVHIESVQLSTKEISFYTAAGSAPNAYYATPQYKIQHYTVVVGEISLCANFLTPIESAVNSNVAKRTKSLRIRCAYAWQRLSPHFH